MDRSILTTGEQFNASDICQTNKNAYVALAKTASAILGTTTLLNGFTCTPTSPASMQIIIGPGEIYEMAATDATAYGDLPVDSHQIYKQGINLDALPANTFTFTAPANAGESVNYLIEFALQENDVDTANRPFFGGPPQVVPTIRQDSVYVKEIAGTPAPTGTQVTPTPEAGFVGGFAITIANGQTTITESNITVYPNAPFITEKLKDKISQAFADARYAQLAAANTFAQLQTMPALVAGVRMGAAQSIAGGNIPVKVDYDTVEFDTYSLWDSTDKRFIPGKLGYWRISVTLFGLSPAFTGQDFYISIFKNNTLYRRLNEITWANQDITLVGSNIVPVTDVNDYIEIFVYNEHPTDSITVGSASSFASSFQIEYLGS